LQFQPSAHHHFVATNLSVLFRKNGRYFRNPIYSKSVYSDKLQHRSLVKVQPLQLQLGF